MHPSAMILNGFDEASLDPAVACQAGGHAPDISVMFKGWIPKMASCFFFLRFPFKSQEGGPPN